VDLVAEFEERRELSPTAWNYSTPSSTLAQPFAPLWHLGLRFNRIDRIFIPPRYTFFFGSPTKKNSGIKRVWSGAISGWMTDQEVFPSAYKWGQKYIEKIRIDIRGYSKILGGWQE
jgi:hypothetical protein